MPLGFLCNTSQVNQHLYIVWTSYALFLSVILNLKFKLLWMLSQKVATLEIISFITIPNKTTGMSKGIF